MNEKPEPVEQASYPTLVGIVLEHQQTIHGRQGILNRLTVVENTPRAAVGWDVRAVLWAILLLVAYVALRR